MSKYVVICAAEGGEKNWGYFRHDYDENSVFCAAEGGGNFCGLRFILGGGFKFFRPPAPAGTRSCYANTGFNCSFPYLQVL